MAVALGGRIAEEIIFGEEEVTTGASNDLAAGSSRRPADGDSLWHERSSSAPLPSVVSKAICSWDATLWPSAISPKRPRRPSTLKFGAWSIKPTRRAKEVLVNNKLVLDKLADMLVEKETVDADELQEVLANNDVKMAAIA